MKADDPWAIAEGTEHQDDPLVLLQVRDRLDTAAGEIEIGHRVIVDHGEGALHALG